MLNNIKISKHAFIRIEERQSKQWTTSGQLQAIVNNIPYKGKCLNLCKEYGWNYYPGYGKYLRYLHNVGMKKYKKKRYYVYKNYMWILNNDENVLVTMYPVLSFEDWLKIS